MKLHKSVLFFLLMMIGVTFAFAQTPPPAPPKFDPEKRAEKITERMTDNLKLSPEQAAKVKAINERYAEKEKALHESTQKQRNERKDLFDAKQKEIDQVLSPEQLKKRDEQKQQFGERRGKAMGQGEKMPPEERAKQMTERMSKNLKLDEQKAKQIGDINLYFVQKTAKIHQDAALKRDQKMQQMQVAMQERDAKLKALLSPEQYQRHQETVKRMEERRAERPKRTERPEHRGRSTIPPPPPPNDR